MFQESVFGNRVSGFSKSKGQLTWRTLLQQRGLRVEGLGFGALTRTERCQQQGWTISGAGCRASAFGFRAWGFGVRGSGFEFRGSGSGAHLAAGREKVSVGKEVRLSHIFPRKPFHPLTTPPPPPQPPSGLPGGTNGSLFFFCWCEIGRVQYSDLRKVVEGGGDGGFLRGVLGLVAFLVPHELAEAGGHAGVVSNTLSNRCGSVFPWGYVAGDGRSEGGGGSHRLDVAQTT